MTTTYNLTRPLPGTGSPQAHFPSSPYGSASVFYGDYVSELERAARTIHPVEIERAAQLLLESYLQGSTVFACGNGGSASIANHLQCDHSNGIRNGTDLVPHVVSLSNNVEVMTAIANDLGYEEVFVHQLQSQARKGDVLFAISSSGNSPNIVKAVCWAKDNGLRTISLTGFDGGGARVTAEVALHVDSHNYGLVEDLHQGVMHALAQYIRQSRLSADQLAATQF
jgi:phosphoheptose isomerase